MKINNLKDFDDAISKEGIFNGFDFNIENADLKIFKFNSAWVSFNDCTFNCKALSINNINQDDLVLEFNNCTFNCDVSFSNCKIDTLKFINTKSIRSLKVNGNYTDFEKKSEIKSFWFSNTKEKDNSEENKEKILSTSFRFFNVLFKKYFEFNNINNSNGIFNFNQNIVGDNEFKYTSSCVFHSSFLSNIRFSDNIFNAYTNFKNSTFSFNKDNFKNTGNHWNESKFERNEFNKVNFSKTNVIDYLEFDNCDFLRTTWFEECVNSKMSRLKFVACKFEKYVLFDGSFFNKLEILHTKFMDKFSFQNVIVNKFKLHQITFKETAYFDDLNKNTNNVIEDWDVKTLRAIKRELANSQNQIDYLRFKAYELNAYKKEIDKNKLSWKDSLILYFNESSNNFGLDWTKGISFIFQWSFIFYLFYIIAYSARVESLDCLPKIEDFASNYLKFTNPLSFLNPPLKQSENYFLPILFLIFGKIFVSYGIYQTIQAFRKFGVNGD
ncbi:hypothetical protein [Flavobacterium sp.]|uniref:hypothetical protein n=1 Tax=Flavobacterium sp. TaxID=239 RepID=UPI0035B3465D